LRTKNQTSETLSRWPVIVGLGLVVLLIIAMIGLDVYFSEEEALRTTDIIENTQRSIVLLDAIRLHAKRLAATNDAREIEQWQQAIAEDSRGYDPTVSSPEELNEWRHLQDLLRRLQVNLATRQPTYLALEGEIDKSVDDLVVINAAEGKGTAAAIRSAHYRALMSDLVVGAVVLAIVAFISGWLLRVLSRQRRLVLERVRLLDEKNAELEAFAGRAAHDLRSPMNPIRGYTDLIIESPAPPENVAAMAQRIRRAVDRMTRVVDDMLALSISGRPPEGRSSSTVVVSHILEEMGAEVQGLELVTRLEGGQVACTEGVLCQILRNLISNAIKFRARSRPLHISIKTRDVGQMVEFTIEDNGVGMDLESAQHAFEPFYRGVTDRETPGHGLGLAIVERTTRALGGTCELSSVPEQSTCVVVRLPRA
jgi:signal transduction histidine kinase